MLASVEEQAAVNFVGENHDVAIANDFCDLLDVAAFEHSASGILRRIQNNQPGSIVDERSELVDFEREVAFFAQMDGHGAAANVVDHRLVNGKAGIGIDDFIALIDERQNRKENNWLAAWDDDHFVACNFYAASAAYVFGEGLA